MEIIEQLNRKTETHSPELKKWMEGHLRNILIPLYSSVDIRVSDSKIAPVDTNIFPAGFNNLTEDFRVNTGKLFKKALNSKYPNAEKILIIPELHTKNRFYWENIKTLETILQNTGYEVRVGIVDEDFEVGSARFATSSGGEVVAIKAKNKDHRIFVEGFCPDVILLNNDFSEKCPKNLRDTVQPVEPPVEMGWHTRRKDVHFEFYNSLASEVAKILEIDPWIISIETQLIKDVNFEDADDRKKVYKIAKHQLSVMKKQYENRGIKYVPKLFIKSNSGTYGMGVVNITDVESIALMNASDRKRLRVTKGGQPVRDIVLQEAVPTILRTTEGSSAEPVIYLVNDEVSGGFFRVNREKNENENLNSKGMTFEPFFNTVGCFNEVPQAVKLISMIAVIASGSEIEKIIMEGGCRETAS